MRPILDRRYQGRRKFLPLLEVTRQREGHGTARRNEVPGRCRASAAGEGGDGEVDQQPSGESPRNRSQPVWNSRRICEILPGDPWNSLAMSLVRSLLAIALLCGGPHNRACVA
jgi:hypothetical protein